MNDLSLRKTGRNDLLMQFTAIRDEGVTSGHGPDKRSNTHSIKTGE
jgi:hypothetical protein